MVGGAARRAGCLTALVSSGRGPRPVELSLGALIGSVVIGLLINGLTVPGRDDTHLLTAIEAIPGALLGIAAFYYEGARRENQAA